MIYRLFLLFALFILSGGAISQTRDIVGVVTNQYSSIATPQVLNVKAQTRYLGKKCDLMAAVNIVRFGLELKIKDVSVSPGSCLGFDPKKYSWNESASQQRGLPFALYRTQNGYTLPAGLELILSVTAESPPQSSQDVGVPILN